MPILPLRKLAERPVERVIAAFLDQIEGTLQDASTDRDALCRRVLCGLLYPDYVNSWETAVEDESVAVATRIALSSLDPRNITLEPEYYAECDEAKFARVKPLLWLWYSFDRSAAGGQNVDLGVRLRRVLAPHIFKRCGRNFKAFQHVEFSFGYNMEVGDDVVIHRHVLLDDRGGIVLGDRVSVSDYANVYSHTHSIVDQRDVTDAVTRPRRRCTDHVPCNDFSWRTCGRERHGRRCGDGHQRCTTVSRTRRDSGQECASKAQCADRRHAFNDCQTFQIAWTPHDFRRVRRSRHSCSRPGSTVTYGRRRTSGLRFRQRSSIWRAGWAAYGIS